MPSQASLRIQPRHSLFNAIGSRVHPVIRTFQKELSFDSWLYAEVIPSTDAPSINPVTHALVGCTGTVDGVKANAAKLGALIVIAEVIDPATSPGLSLIEIGHSSGGTLATLYVDATSKGKSSVQVAYDGDGYTFSATGAQTLLLDTTSANSNVKLYIFAGFNA